MTDFKRGIPRELQTRHWIAWGPDPKSGRPKCPLKITNPKRRASTRTPETWQEFDFACTYLERLEPTDGTRGVGYVFTLERGLLYVDLDDCLDDSGNLREWAQPFVDPFLGLAYIEVSPSKHGLHIITKGMLPVGAGAGGKVNLPEWQSDWAKTKNKVPEIACFAEGKYTTITADVWNEQREIGDGTKALAQVWEQAGINSIASEAQAGPAPEDNELPDVEEKRIPKAVREELEACTAGEALDRSVVRWKLYADASKRLEPLEIFAIVITSAWYDGSGAADKGRHHTWSDIVRCCAKADTAKKEFEEVKESRKAERETAATNWEELGIPTHPVQSGKTTYTEVVHGVQAIAVMLEKHPDWAGRFRKNTFTEHIELDGMPITERVSGLAEAARGYLGWDREPPLGNVRQAVYEAAEAQAYNPVAEWLSTLKWDGIVRASDWLARAGCEDDDLTRDIGRKWLIALVARALKPGCKMDNVLILEGDQGLKKSTMLETLAGTKLFTNSRVTLDKDGMMILHGHWIVELAELNTFKGGEADAVKQFISATNDTFRPPYERSTVTKPRHFLITGSTNDPKYLTDIENRRYWPVKTTGKLNPGLVAAEREQLFAEAVMLFERGEPWWHENAPEALLARQEARVVQDPLTDQVIDFLEKTTEPFTLSELIQDLGLSAADERLGPRLSKILRRKKFYSIKGRRPGGPTQNLWRDSLFTGQVLDFPKAKPQA